MKLKMYEKYIEEREDRLSKFSSFKELGENPALVGHCREIWEPYDDIVGRMIKSLESTLVYSELKEDEKLNN